MSVFGLHWTEILESFPEQLVVLLLQGLNYYLFSADSVFRRLNLSPAVASVVTYACGKKKLTERSGGISTIVKLLLKGCSSLKNQLTVELFRNQSRFKRSAVSQGCSENDDPENEDPITQTTENCK